MTLHQTTFATDIRLSNTSTPVRILLIRRLSLNDVSYDLAFETPTQTIGKGLFTNLDIDTATILMLAFEKTFPHANKPEYVAHLKMTDIQFLINGQLSLSDLFPRSTPRIKGESYPHFKEIKIAENYPPPRTSFQELLQRLLDGETESHEVKTLEELAQNGLIDPSYQEKTRPELHPA